jgi:hypothetical protein
MLGPHAPPPDAVPHALAERVQGLVDAALKLLGGSAWMPAALEAEISRDSVATLLRVLQSTQHALKLSLAEPTGPLWGVLRRRRSANLIRDRWQDTLATRDALVDASRALRSSHAMRHERIAATVHSLARAGQDMEPIVQRAQGLLTTLWDALVPKRPDPTDQASLLQLQGMAADADRLRATLKRLEGVHTGAADVARLGEAVLDGRAELIARLGPRFDEAWGAWKARVEPLAEPGAAVQDVLLGWRLAEGDGLALLELVDAARVVCTRVQIDEQAMAQALAQLREQIATFTAPAP